MASDTQRNWIGFDLGGTKMLSAAYDDNFNLLARQRQKTMARTGLEAGLERITGLIRKVLDEAQLGPSDLAGIGIGCPGPLDLDEGIILDTPNLGWHNVAIKRLLEKEFRCPAVIANDVDAGVFGEYRFGAAEGARCVLGVFPGTGIGGGLVYQGEILRGKTGSAMEIGHIQAVPDGPLCGCGQKGCLEACASRLAVAAAAAQAAVRGQAPHLLSIAGTDLSNIRSGALAESIEQGDKVVAQIVRNAAKLIGIAVGNAVNLLAPDMVVLGGGMAEAMPDLFVENVRKAAMKRVLPSLDSFDVVAAKLGDDAGVMGAAAWAKASANK